MTLEYRTKLILKIIDNLKKDKLRMEAGTLVSGWKYRVSISLKDYQKQYLPRGNT